VLTGGSSDGGRSAPHIVAVDFDIGSVGRGGDFELSGRGQAWLAGVGLGRGIRRGFGGGHQFSVGGVLAVAAVTRISLA
jgi:hypothetical protein